MDSREVFRDALRTWGAEAQTKMLFEEIGELMQAVCKASRVKNWEQRAEVWHNIAEEIADVKIMLGQMEILFDVEDAVEECTREKIDRLVKRLEAAHVKEEAGMPAWNTQKKFFERKALGADTKKRRERDDLRAERQLYEAEKRSDEYERGERDHL